MSTALQYLEEAKIEELVRELADKGYIVRRDAPIGDDPAGPRFDILARHGDRLVAIEVKAAGQLGAAATQIAHLRQLAHAHGIDEFRVVVAQPPRPVKVVVEGLDQGLLTYMSAHIPAKLLALAARPRIEEVYDVDVSELTVGPEDMQLAGDGLVAVNLAPDYNEAAGNGDLRESFPFSFHVTLDVSRQITAASFDVDTSSWAE